MNGHTEDTVWMFYAPFSSEMARATCTEVEGTFVEVESAAAVRLVDARFCVDGFGWLDARFCVDGFGSGHGFGASLDRLRGVRRSGLGVGFSEVAHVFGLAGRVRIVVLGAFAFGK